jgi:hypothetical protein
VRLGGKSVIGDRRITWSETDDNILQQLHASGNQLRAIARKLGRDPLSISNRLQYLKRRRRRVSLTDRFDVDEEMPGTDSLMQPFLAMAATRETRASPKDLDSAIDLMSDVDRYRREAERCRRLAARTIDLVEKSVLQRMADELLRRALAAQNGN